MYENLTPEYIKNDILSDGQVAQRLSTREGAFTNTLVGPVSYELWKAFQALDAVVPMVYIDETSGQYIDKKAAAYGIIRKPGARATAVLHFTGTDGTVIQKGKVFLTADSLQFTQDEELIISSGVAQGSATAIDIGEIYDVEAGAIFRQLVNQPGIESVTSETATGGTDTETDTALVARYYDYLRNPGTSGNVAHYRQWVLEVDGVGDVRVIPLWNGPGTVKVLIVSPNNQPVDEVIVANCVEHIEENRPIGATVTVLSASGRSIDVAATVILKPSTDAGMVKAAFDVALAQYLRDIAFTDYLVVYNRIGYILLDIDGVVDFSSLTVNGGTNDIAIGEDDVPVVGNVEVTA